MQIDDELYHRFLEEMDRLEHFRLQYLATHPQAGLEREDPDVRRLIEAMAFFTVNTAKVARRNIDAARLRLFRQFFSYLLTPSPAMGLLQCRTSARFTNPITIPKKSEVAITSDGKHRALFHLLYDLKILPLSLTDAQLLLRPHKGYRLLLKFKTPYPRNDEIGKLSIHVSHFNNYPLSLRVFHTIKRHLQKTSYFFNEKVDEHSQGGTPCEVSFGTLNNPREVVNSDLSHPMQIVDAFFHFPQQDLYIHFDVAETQRGWRNFTLCLDLDEHLPRNFAINRDMFQLFVVPVINLRYGPAQPILYDGLRDRHPLRYPEAELQFDVHSVRGVYQSTEQGLAPLRAGILSGGSGSYEVEIAPTPKNPKCHWLLLNLPQAFEQPVLISTEALWYQPWFSDYLDGRIDLVLQDRHVEGVRWELLEPITPHRENTLANDTDQLLELLRLQSKSSLSLEELLFVMRALGCVERSHFKEMPQLLKSLRTIQTPDSATRKLKYVYEISLREFDPVIRPLIEEFLRQALNILKAYASGGIVTLKVAIPGTEEVLHFT